MIFFSISLKIKMFDPILLLRTKAVICRCKNVAVWLQNRIYNWAFKAAFQLLLQWSEHELEEVGVCFAAAAAARSLAANMSAESIRPPLIPIWHFHTSSASRFFLESIHACWCSSWEKDAASSHKNKELFL